MVKKYVCDVECPWCNKMLSVNKEVEIKSPMIPAEKEERYYTERLAQTTLTDHIKTDTETEDEP